jgi:P-type E1-E2 ATPase
MIEIEIPGRGTYTLEHLVLDMNGTIALDGELLPDVQKMLAALRWWVHTVIVTADTHGGAEDLKKGLGVDLHMIQPGEEAAQKLELVTGLSLEHTVAIGNGANDAAMLEACALGICILGKEGAATEALLKSDMVMVDIRNALDLLLRPKRIVATLRR